MLLARYTTLFATSALVCAVASSAHAAGFQLKEQGAALQGLSFAGATAKTDDLSTIFFNPAGMTRLEGDQLDVTVSVIAPSSKLTISSIAGSTGGGGNFPANGDSNGGDAGKLAAVPAFYAMWDVNPKIKAGLAVNTPFGLATEYDDGWAGRYYALESELKTINIAPSLAYKVDDKLSLGGGVQVQYASARLTGAVNYDAIFGGSPADGKSIMEGDDIGWGFNFGALYEFDENTRIGASYRSRVHHSLEGDLNITNQPGPLVGNANFSDADIKAKLVTPDMFSVGIYHGLNEKWAVLADAAWTNWSLFKDLTVTNAVDNLQRQHVEENWEDTYFVALGTEYKRDADTTYQFGVAYDKSPVKDEYRTFRIPDSDRFWVSAGYRKNINQKWTFNAGYSHIFAQDATVTEDAEAATHGTISGEFNSNVNILSLGLKYNF